MSEIMSEVKKNSILIVDDQNSNITALIHILGSEYTIHVAKNGRSAIQAAHKHLPDVILLDIIMPEMDGYSVLAELKAYPKTQNIPVIFISGLSDAADEEKGLAFGVSDYITKPFSAAIVKLRVKNQMKLIEQFRLMETEIERQTSTLKLQTATLQTIINSIPDFVFCKDLNSNYTMLNSSLADSFGVNVDCVIGKGDVDGLKFSAETAEKMIAADKKVFIEGRATVDEDLVPVGDSERYLQTIKAPLMQDGVIIGLVGISRDITDIKRLAKQQAEAEMTNRAKSVFLANMSHEIRTPMNAILGITEIMMQSETLPEQVEEGLSKIYSSCDLLLGIINDILDFSKIEAGKLDIIPDKYNVANLINDSTHLNMMKIDGKPIVFELQIDENIPAKLKGDELRIKQILHNLLSNAFKYTDAGKVTLSVAYESGDKGAGTLILSVRDTGHGMTGEQVGRLFEEYSRFNQELSRSVQGTGLGLAITQRLVNLMNGRIHVESEPGKGSLFVVRLPQDMAGSGVLGTELAANLREFRMDDFKNRKKTQIVRDPMPYGKVLIVDDVETNLYVAAGLMRPYRLQIDTCMNGRCAIDKVEAGKEYDIIFMDHMMPEMDGMETTKRLRDWGYTAPVVALTANAVTGQVDMFLQNGFDAFISKPIDVRQLDSVLNKFIRGKQPPEVIEAAHRQMGKLETGGGEQSQMDSLLLESFLRDARKTVSVLENARQNKGFENDNDLQSFIIAVHGIKSSLANIGENALSGKAAMLEKSGRKREIDAITEAVPPFLKELLALVEKLELKQGVSSSCGGDENIEDLAAKLLSVKELCADYNRKGALDMLAGIKNCSAETRAVLNGIKELVLCSGFDEAESMAAAFAERLSFANAGRQKNGALTLNAKIDGLDMVKGLERYEGDEKLYLKVLRSYAVNIAKMLDSIKSVCKDTLANYEIIVHGIKGASFDICAQQIGKDAKELEAAAEAGDLDYVNKHNGAFHEKTRKLISALEDMVAAIDAQNPKPQKDKPDGELLLGLLAACRKYSVDGADAAIAQIEKYRYTSDGGLAEWLRERVDVMDFEQIIEKLSNPVAL